jgi:hypothetical protein
MHLTLKNEAIRPAGVNFLQQQAKFDAFLEEFNLKRPHEALAMKCPAEVYSASSRPYLGIPEPHYSMTIMSRWRRKTGTKMKKEVKEGGQIKQGVDVLTDPVEDLRKAKFVPVH